MFTQQKYSNYYTAIHAWKHFHKSVLSKTLIFKVIQILKLEIESEFPLIFHRVITIMLSENSGVTLPSAKTFVLLTELFVSWPAGPLTAVLKTSCWKISWKRDHHYHCPQLFSGINQKKTWRVIISLPNSGNPLRSNPGPWRQLQCLDPWFPRWTTLHKKRLTLRNFHLSLMMMKEMMKKPVLKLWFMPKTAKIHSAPSLFVTKWKNTSVTLTSAKTTKVVSFAQRFTLMTDFTHNTVPNLRNVSSIQDLAVIFRLISLKKIQLR